MGRDDWFRRTTWTERDAQEFHQRNKRSRGLDSKAQYLAIQAETLLATNDPICTRAALELAQLAIADYPNTMSYARALDCAGRCHAHLGNTDDAIHFFMRALERQREFPGIQTNACFNLGRLVVEERREEHFDAALEALEEFGAPVFPWHGYMVNGVRAQILAVRGFLDDAARLARLALEAAAITDSGLGWGREKVGLVSDDGFYRTLVELAAT